MSGLKTKAILLKKMVWMEKWHRFAIYWQRERFDRIRYRYVWRSNISFMKKHVFGDLTIHSWKNIAEIDTVTYVTCKCPFFIKLFIQNNTHLLNIHKWQGEAMYQHAANTATRPCQIKIVVHLVIFVACFKFFWNRQMRKLWCHHGGFNIIYESES